MTKDRIVTGSILSVSHVMQAEHRARKGQGWLHEGDGMEATLAGRLMGWLGTEMSNEKGAALRPPSLLLGRSCDDCDLVGFQV